jgi:hypothetical protein
MSPVQTPITVKLMQDRRTRHDWLALPAAIFADDPNWVEPLRLLERRRVSQKHNPFFTFGEAEFFIAYRGARPVGRISAQINRRHLERYRDATGHFGFFDCHDDPEAAAVLVNAAAQWLRARGMTRMVGPLSLSINDEPGLLVSGFDTPPANQTPHSRPWYGPLLERSGLSKEVDLFAYRMKPADAPPIIHRLAGLAARSGNITVRPLDMSNFGAEMAILIDIFNDAWGDNWGFVPFSRAEIDAIVSETRYVLRGKYGRFLFVDGEPAGVIVCLPDLNNVISRTGGRLLPLNWLRLGMAFWREQWRTARIPLLGLRKGYRSSPLSAAMLALLVEEFIEEARHYPHQWVEFSWILESNKPMVALAELAAGAPAKTYRVYTKSLTR